MFIEEMKIWIERCKVLFAEHDAAQGALTGAELLHSDLGRVYREKVVNLTAAFQDEARKHRRSNGCARSSRLWC